MSVLKKNELISPFWLPNGHLQSIYPALFRKIIGVTYKRERISTPDNDFLDLDWSFSETGQGKGLVILSHGLEGNSTRQYILGMVKVLNKNGYDCLAWNYRSCSGEINKTPRFYHSGATDDLALVVGHAIKAGYDKIDLIGFSLGGNVTLKYLGEMGTDINSKIRKAVVFSVPMDLNACSLAILKPENRIYMYRFLRTLKPKIVEKSRLFPDKVISKDYRFVKTLYDFDHIYTAPLHGFESAADYYEKCSSMFFVENVKIPTLVVHAANDPIVPFSSLPKDLIFASNSLIFDVSSHGGHCGFRPSQLPEDVYWSESRALQFLNED